MERFIFQQTQKIESSNLWTLEGTSLSPSETLPVMQIPLKRIPLSRAHTHDS